MDWQSIFASAGIATLLTTLITTLFTFLLYRSQKKIDFAYDYKKYILERRQKAYEKVESVLHELTERRSDFDNDNLSHALFYSPDDPGVVFEFTRKLTASTAEEYLFSQNFFQLCRELLEATSNAHAEFITLPVRTVDSLREIGEKHFEKIEDLRIEAYQQFFEDIKSLGNIDRFIANRVGKRSNTHNFSFSKLIAKHR